jgi:hypothetical protein
MKGFNPGTLGRELNPMFSSRTTTTPTINGKRLLRPPTPSESEEYEQDHLIPGISLIRRESAIDNIFNGEDSEDILGDSSVCFHPGSSSEESDLHLPYHNPGEQVEHEYNGETPTDW